jgi:protein-tyrosine phosphatase
VIDLHCHLLPGVDDGARTVEQAAERLHWMAGQGIREICLTPHLEAGRIAEGPPAAHDEAFAVLSGAAPAEIRLHRGAEVMLDRPLPERAIASRRITLGGTRYILVEFTRLVAASAATAALAQLVRGGLRPVLAHPERYASCSPDTVRQWREVGAAMQVDANTLFEPTARGQRARALVTGGLADILAADNHGDDRSLLAPFERLSAGGGEAVATLLMIRNPAAILADEPLEPAPTADLKISLLTRIRGWLGETGSGRGS